MPGSPASAFARNLQLVLKILSLNGARLAAELKVDKSIVSRWLSGGAKPSTYNLTRLSELVATRAPGFSVLDWERTPESLAGLFGVDAGAIPATGGPQPSLNLPETVWSQILSTSAVRGAAYEGFFKLTRPNPRAPGRFVHEWSMVRMDDRGLLTVRMGSQDSRVEGLMFPLHGLVYSVCAELNSGTLAFGIFIGAGGGRVDVLDGLTLLPAGDMGRAPQAACIISERIGDLSGDHDADDRRFRELAAQNPLAPDGSIPKHIEAHLLRDVGPEQFAGGGELMLTMSLLRTMSRGPDYDRSD